MTYDSHNDPDVYDEFDSGSAASPSNPFLTLLRGRWHWAILLAVLLGGGGLYLGYNFQKDEYKGVSTIELKPDYNVPVDVTDSTLNESYQNFVNGQIRTLLSLEVIEGAMAQPEWQEAVAQRPADLPEISVDDFADKIEIDDPDRSETIMTVEFIDQDPETARAGVNALLASYGQVHKQSETAQIDNNLRLLQDQLRNLENEKVLTERQISLIIPSDEALTINSRLSTKLRELAAMEYRLSEIDLELKPYLEAIENPDAERDFVVIDPRMAALLEERQLLEERYDELTIEGGRGEDMPDVKAISRAIATVSRKIVDLENEMLANPTVQDDDTLPPVVAELVARRKVLLGKVDELTAITSDLGTRIKSVEDNKLKIEDIRESVRSTKDAIAKHKATIDLSQNNDVSRIVMGDASPTPTQPANTEKRIQFAGMGSILGTAMGFGLMMLVGLMDRRVRHASDTNTSMPEANVLGILPTLPAKLTDPDEAEAVAHCVHHIRTLLQIGGSNRVFSITSPTPGSGKSSLATALGMSFAASGSRTLVIDADLIGAGISRRMGLVVHEALEVVIRRNSLLDEAQLSSAMTKATVSGKLLEQVLLDESLMSQEQLEVAQRLQRDTSLGLLEACGPRQLAPPAARQSKDEDLLIMLGDSYGSDSETAYAHHEEPAISMFDNASQSRLVSCVAHTGIENFSVLPVGKAKPSDASRLSPAAMRELVRQGREAFDIVLIDTGPVLGSLEASIAAAESDATVVIVSRGDQKSLVNRSLDQLRSVRAQIAGLVFNHALDRDLDHVSYASQVSQDRRADRGTRKKALGKHNSARLGPLGTAVATFTNDDEAPTNGTYNHGLSDR